MSPDFNKLRKDFPILNHPVRGKPLAYLDNAATTLKPLRVSERVEQHYSREASNVHRGVHYFSEKATLDYEEARETIAGFINAREPAEIIFTSGTTDAINLVAGSWGRQQLGKDDEILLTWMEHHSNIVPWQMLAEEKGCRIKVVPINDDGELVMEEFYRLLSKRTRLLATTWISNAIGTVNPVAEMTRAAHEVGAKVLVDAAQAVAHTPVDVQAGDFDFLALSGHKVFGPTGIGVLYGKKSLLDSMPPVRGGGSMIRSVSFEKTTYAGVPARFEAGTPHIAGAIGMAEGIRYLQEIGLEHIQAREDELLAYGTRKLLEVPGVRIIGNAPHKAAILSFVVDGIHPHDLGTLLDQEGVAIRSGHHCAQPLMERYKVPATSRASLAFYNNEEDIDALCAALIKAREIFS